MVLKFFNKRFVVFLFLLVLVSYGLILFMTPWQEDNVIFFKVAHIDEQAGYLGKGILGEGPYRHTITPYYFLYKVFGYNIPVFYGLMLLSYFFATVCVYLLVRNVVNEKAGRIASFLFGAGYIASEGFLRVYTSTNISSGIGFTALLFLSYWAYYKKRRIKWFFLTVLMYWLTVQVSYVRVHYLIIPLLIFDILFLVVPKLSNLKWFFLRSIPFVYIFYRYYIVQGDSRRGGILEVVKAILSGKFEYTHSFLGTLGNLVAPDFIQKIPVVIGLGVVALSLFLIKVFQGEKRKIFILFLTIIMANIAAYAAYTPKIIYATNYRYLAHSFLGLCVILALFTLTKRKVVTIIVVLLGIVFLVLNVKNQALILSERTAKIKTFYGDLERQLSQIPKGSVIYFDVQDSEYAKDAFKVSFSVAEMPETTAIAWRYGIDRYDFKMFTDFESLKKEILENKVPKEKIFSFWLSKDGLVDTSDQLRQINKPQNNFVSCRPDGELTIDCPGGVGSFLPIEISFDLVARLSDPSQLHFPYRQKEVGANPYYTHLDLALEAMRYLKEKQHNLENSDYSASSNWKERTIANINDGDPGTVWQSDRIAWGREATYVIIKRSLASVASRIIILPGHSNNVPSKIRVESSSDGVNWVEIISSLKTDGDYLVVDIEYAAAFSYLKIIIDETSGGDSPQIAEAWIVSGWFDRLSISEAEVFLGEPFTFVKDAQTYKALVDFLGKEGRVKVYWLGDKSEKWLSEFGSVVEVIYDGKNRTYRLTTPPGGTRVDKFKFEQVTIPGDITIYKISARPARGGTP